MSAVLDIVDASTSTSTSIAAEVNIASVTRRHEDIDRHVARVAQQIAHLIEPIMTTWSQSSSFPGWGHLVAAYDLLLHLTDETAEWDEGRAKPSVCDLMLEIQTHLEQALGAINTSDALDGHDARRLLTTEALTRAKAACHWCSDAHAQVDSEAAPSARTPAPAPAGEPVSATDKRLQQHAKAFEGIALQASILLQLVDQAGTAIDADALTDSIRIIVASIGSLADGYNREDQRGNQYAWQLGERAMGGSYA